jgi:hypothetical protein
VTYHPSGAHSSGAQFTFRSGNETLRVAVSGKGVAPTRTITVNPTSLEFKDVNVGTQSSVQTFTVTGQNLSGNLTVTPPTNFTVSPTTISAADAAAGKTVRVWFNAPDSIGKYTGIITVSGGGASSKTVNVTGYAIPEGVSPY